MKEKNIQELAIRMGLITVEDMCQYTIAQLVVKIANKVNELVSEVWRFETDVQETLKTQNENIQYLLGEGLHLEVENIFDGWVQDGTFDTLLNQSALKRVNDRIDETNARLSQKIGKGEGGVITKAMLSQEVKEAMTAGSVGVVDIDSVLTENIVNKQVTPKKTNFINIITNNLYDDSFFDYSGYYQNGVFINENKDYGSTGFLEINHRSGDWYYAKYYGHISIFDASKNFIEQATVSDGYFNLPNNAVYLNVAVEKSRRHDFYVLKKSNNLILNYELDTSIKPSKELINYINGLLLINKENCDFITKERTENLFNKNDILIGKYYSSSDGSLNSLSGWNASDFIEVNYGKSYVWNTVGHVCLWDASKRFVSGFNGNRTTITDTSVKYMTISVSDARLDTEMVVAGTIYPSKYIPYTIFKLDKQIEIYKESVKTALDEVIGDMTTSSLSNLKWNVLGDSISSTNYANGHPYWWHLSQKISNLAVRNYAVSGAWISKGGNATLSETYLSMDDDADLITVWAGTNDDLNTNPLGAMDDRTNTTFYGALHVLYSGLINKYPGKKIGIISIMLRSGYIAGDGSNWDKKNNAIKEVAKYYNIPVFNAHEELNLNPNITIIKNTYCEDGLHPNELAHEEIIARRLVKWLESL